jgi:Uma2 family endonuclease
MLTLPRTLQLTPLQFAEVCANNPEAVLELDADGQLLEKSPTGGDTRSRNSTLIFLLEIPVRQSGLPLKVFDSSGGFLLPVGSVRSLDANLVRLERWQALSEGERRGFPLLCPDLVMELASPSDRAALARRKQWSAPGELRSLLVRSASASTGESGPARSRPATAAMARR